jgi:hypothetical protein
MDNYGTWCPEVWTTTVPEMSLYCGDNIDRKQDHQFTLPPLPLPLPPTPSPLPHPPPSHNSKIFTNMFEIEVLVCSLLELKIEIKNFALWGKK